MRWLTLPTVIATFLLPANSALAHPTHVMDWRFYHRLALCETGGDLNHSTLSYTGAFGVYRQTWRQYSEQSSAHGLSASEQAVVVDRLAFTGWENPQGIFKWPVGPWGFGTIRRNCRGLQALICESRSSYVQRWKRKCQ